MLISVFWGRYVAVVGFCILFLVFGAWWHGKAELMAFDNEMRQYNDQEQQVTLMGMVDDEPDVREKSIKIKVKSEELEINGEPFSISGYVLVTSWRYPEYQYGDKLVIAGRLESPPVFEGFNYQDYLKKDKIYSVMSFPKIELVDSGFGNPIMEPLFSFKNRFKEISRKLIPLPQEGLLEALAFGDENNISQEWKDKLNFTGTRHIAAVSGMNTTIISVVILSFLLSFGLWRKHAFYLSIVLLLLYILMIGAPASAVRAGIMAGLFLLCQYLGRMNVSSRAVVFAAVIMLLFNPLILELDVGFQLSFLAILGMVCLQPVFSEILKKVPNFRFFPLKTTLEATLSAQVFTLPILIYNFGYMPLVSPIANILIVPFLALITILIFVFGLAGMVFWPLAVLLSFPVWLSLAYLTRIIDMFSRFPFASLRFENVHWLFLLVSYTVLVMIVWRTQENQKLKFLKY
ncbi:MAG: ComEC family competence protein [Candidatus Pacebacteria bacterium]|nr:ComEC family competence protein [Candidatus Paceibacterota bacterium]